MTRRRRSLPVVALGGVVALAVVASCASGGPTTATVPPPVQGPVLTSATAQDARAQLAHLAVKGRAPKTGYRRSEFGDGWTDTDHDGCRTRDEVLARDLTAVVERTRCVVVAGTLLDPYTHQVIAFSKARADEVQIDHVVSLSDAWQTGAQYWPAAKRVAFANDLHELLAVSGAANQAKSDSDAASWLPPYRPFWCAFVEIQVRVKAAYGLWVTPAEHDAMARVLGRC